MEVKITNKLKDYMQFAKELRKDKKSFNSLFKSMLGLYFLFSMIIYMIINIFLCYNPFYYPTMPEFLIIILVVFFLYFLLEYKSDFMLASSHIKYCKSKSLELVDNGIKLNSPLGLYYIHPVGIKKFYETETFFALSLSYAGITELMLLKKAELNYNDVKNKLISITNLPVEQNETNKSKICIFILKYVFFLLSFLLFLEISLIFVHYPMDRNYHNQIFVSKLNFLYVTNDSKYWEIGLRPYDIPIEINGENVVNLTPQHLEERLKGKNIKLKVLKRETGELVEYIIN